MDIVKINIYIDEYIQKDKQMRFDIAVVKLGGGEYVA
jgi:hypothetical protein